MKQFSDWMIVGAFTFGVGIVGYLRLQKLMNYLIRQYVEIILVV
jgi:hypothetical protein